MLGVQASNLAMGIAGEWKPRWKVLAPLVIAKDQTGKLHHAYRGSMLAWLSDEQSAHFLRKGLVEAVGDDAPEMPSSDAVGNCVAQLSSLGVDLKAGRPTARKALEAAGHRWSNEVIAEAVRIRQSHAPDEDDDFPVI